MDLKLLDCSWLTTLLVFVVTFLLAYISTRRPTGIPPGPALIPVIGNLHTMAIGDLLKNLRKLRMQHGDIFSLYLGNELMIFLNGHKVIHDAFVKKGSQFTGRPITEFHKMWVKVPGIIFATGAEWKEQRRAAVEIFQDICFKQNGKAVAKVVKSEVEKLLQVLGQQKEPFDLDSFVTISVCNVICQVVYSTCYDFDDPVIKNYLNEVQQGAKVFMVAQTLCNSFPFLQSLPFDFIKVKRVNDMETKVRAFMESNVDKVKRSSNDRLSNFVQQYLKKVEVNKEEGKQSSMDESHLVSVLIDLFAAGTETTANTVRWIILYLIGKQDIQNRLYKEISATVGSSFPAITDRNSLPYTQAVILEGLRIAPAVPLGIPHTVPRDTIFHDYKIPKNCSVMANINSALMDPDIWPNPEQFRPERFLNADQTEVVIPKEFVPFSTGPRSCIGETFSRIELHLFVTALFQKFRFLPENDDKIPKPIGNLGVSYSPPAFNVRVEKR